MIIEIHYARELMQSFYQLISFEIVFLYHKSGKYVHKYLDGSW